MTTPEMLKEIVAQFNLSGYFGTQNKIYRLNNAQERKIAKEFLGRHRDMTKEQFHSAGFFGRLGRLGKGYR